MPAQPPAHLDNGLHQQIVLAIMGDTLHQQTVDLDEIQRVAFEVGKTGIAGTEIIHRNADADLTQRMAESDGPEWDRLSEQIVGEVMTRKVVALPPEADVTEAARLMVETQVRRVIVAEGHALQGVVSAMDFVRAVAEGKLRPSS
jgi:predicted transcriptional regulator